MVKYKVIQEGKDFYIKEVQTDQLVMMLDSKEEAYKVTSRLNLGAGFDGFTPRFFLTE
jgi:hypothetical protein